MNRVRSDEAALSRSPECRGNPRPFLAGLAIAQAVMGKVTPFLMFNDQFEAAIAFYTATFRDSEIRKLSRGGQDGPITSAEFVVGGQVFMGYDGGPHFAFSEGFSLFVDCEDQAEVDRYWDKLLGAGAKPSQCGWITDPFGVTWQIVPRVSWN